MIVQTDLKNMVIPLISKIWRAARNWMSRILETYMKETEESRL
jgi:hypothetical protein